MDDGKDRFGDKMRLVERAKENTYFAAKDREAIEKLRAQLAAAQDIHDQQMVDIIDQALAEGKEAKRDAKVTVHRILVPMDFSDCAGDALDYATMMATQFKAKVILVHVIEAQGLTGGFTLSVQERDQALEAVAGKLLADTAASLEAGGVGVTREVRKGVSYEQILKGAEEHNADLIVMGTNGRTGLERLVLGSVAEKVVRLAKCAVLTVHPVAE
jgi:nucleotide-binding universal stress UspA family protein